MPRRLKVGVIGCGNVTQSIHLNSLARMPEVQVLALADPDTERRGGASRRLPGAITCASYQELLSLPEVEAVLVCVPTALHAEVAVAALERGKHLYLEKPLAANLEDAQRVLAAWHRTDVIGMMGFNYRFNPLYKAVREHIKSGRLGELVGLRSVFSTPARSLPIWKRARLDGGGVLLDLASHHVDLVRFFFAQEISQVHAELRSHLTEDDTAMLQLRLAEGLLVQSFFSMSAVNEDRFEIYGQLGKLTVDRYRSYDAEFTQAGLEFSLRARATRELRSLANGRHLFRKLVASGYEPSYRAALNHFVEAVMTKRPANPDLRDGYRSLAVIDAAEASARSGRPVPVRADEA